jgi:hypothetical protein
MDSKKGMLISILQLILFNKKIIFSSIVAVIVKRYFVIIVQIIGTQVQHQSMIIFRFLLLEKKFFYFFSSHHRLCDFCHEKITKETLMSNYTMLDNSDNDNETKNDLDLNFEVRSERLTPTRDNQSLSQEQ